MQIRLRNLLVLFGVGCVALAAGAGLADASRGIELGSTRFGVSGVYTINGAIQCQVLFGFELDSRTVVKATGVSQGAVTSGYWTNCSGIWVGTPNTGVVLLPATVEYRTFTGSLPDISRIDIVVRGIGVSMNFTWGNCLYGGDIELGLNVSGGQVSSVGSSSPWALAKRSGGPLCFASLGANASMTTFLEGRGPTVFLL